MAEFRMPSLGADMEAGVLVRWLVKPGDQVKRGDVVAEVETDKATVQVETFESGVVERLVVPEGEKVPVGTILATLAEKRGGKMVEGRAASVAPAEVELKPTPHVTPTARLLAESLGVRLDQVTGTGVGRAVTRADVERAAAAGGGRPGRVRASPLARKLAIELGVDLAAVMGSAPGGAVNEADVRKAAGTMLAAKVGVGAAPTPTPPSQAAPSPRGRRSIAAAMERSKREIPHYYLANSVDLGWALAWLETANEARPVPQRLLYAVLLLKAVALAVRDVPEMNGWWTGGEFRPSTAVHLGVAISLRDGGLVAPAIHDADRLSLDDLMAALRDLVKRARTGILRSSELADPTITVTNLGEQGVESAFPIIFAPQVAMVGFGKVAERPWAVDGMLTVRPVVQTTLAADHRVSDGHRGGLFLAALDRLLREPEKL